MRKFVILLAAILLIGLTACGEKVIDKYTITPENANLEMYISTTAELKYTIKNQDDAVVNKEVTITVNDPEVIEVNGNVITALKQGNAIVTIRLKDHSMVKTEVNVTVNMSLIVSKPSSDIYVGQQLTLTFEDKADIDNKGITWTSSDATIATVENGVVTGVKPGQVTITAKSNTNNQEVTLTFQIKKVDIETITIDPVVNADVLSEFQLTYTVFPALADQEVKWTCSHPSYATVDDQGFVKTLKPGEVTITATSVSDPSKKATVTFTITVDPIKIITAMNIENPIRQYVTTYGNTEKQQWVYGSVSQYFNSDMNLIEKIVPINQNKYTGTVANQSTIADAENQKAVRSGILHPETKLIVFHDTGNNNPGANAAMHHDYMISSGNKNDRARSWHYTVDENEIIHHIPDNEVTWQGDNFEAYAYGIGIETCVDYGSDLYATWQRTAKLMASLLVKYNLTTKNIKQHHDFQAVAADGTIWYKDCPRTLRHANLYDYIIDLIQAEYNVLTLLKGYTISFKSLNPTLVDDRGRVIKAPATATRVGYVVNITKDDYNESVVLYSTIPGQDGTTEVNNSGTVEDLKAAQNVDLLIVSLPDIINTDNASKVSEARNAYDALTQAQKNLVSTLSILVKKESDVKVLVVDNLILGLPSKLTIADEELVNAARQAYDGLTSDEKKLVKQLDLLVTKEKEILGLKNPDLIALYQLADAIPEQIVTDFTIPKVQGVTLSYKDGEDTSCFNLTTGKLLKVTYGYKPVILVAECNQSTLEIRVNFGLLQENQKAIFATGATAPKAGGTTKDGKGTYNEQLNTAGFGGVAISFEDKVYFIGKNAFITLTKPASGNTPTNEQLKPYGTTGIFNESLVNGVPKDTRGTGVLYYNASGIDLTFDPSYTYGRNNAAAYGYGKIVFSPNPDGTYTVNKPWNNSGENNSTLDIKETLKPGEYLFCPHTYETNIDGGTWLMIGGVVGTTGTGVLSEGSIISIFQYKYQFN